MSRERLRVAFVIGSAEVGGAEHLIESLVRSLPPDAFECSIVCPAGPLVPRYREAAAHVHDIGARSFLNPAVIAEIAAALRRWKIDVVHTCLFLSDVGGILAARVAGVPHVVSHVVGHNFDITGDRGLRRARRQVWSWLYRGIYRLSDRLIAVSSAVKRDLIERPGIRVPEGKITVVHHSAPTTAIPIASIEDEESIRAAYALPADAPVITAIANLYPLKGHRYLLEAMAITARSLPELRCVCIGDGPSRAELQRLAAALGIEKQVLFPGVLSESRRNAVVAMSRAIVLPSLSEGLPVVILEAMAAGKPVVATDVGGIPELVIDGTTGVLVPPADARGLADAIMKVVVDGSWARALGAAGRRRLDESFSPETVIGSLCAVYGSVTGRAIESQGDRADH